MSASDQNSKTMYAVLEKWIFENFRGHFDDYVINKDDLYLLPNLELKIEAKDLNFGPSFKIENLRTSLKKYGKLRNEFFTFENNLLFFLI